MNGLQEANEIASPIDSMRIAFVGKLGGLSKRDAMQLVRRQGGIANETPSTSMDLIVIGAEESSNVGQLLPADVRGAAGRGELEIISETEFWQRMGMVDAEPSTGRLYTPAMLAELLGVSVRIIRRWHRRGLIVPARTVHKLPYFDFQEIAAARRLGEMVAAGMSPQAIESKLATLSEVLPNVERPLAQLAVLVEGKQILLRQGEGLIEPGGQLRIDFDSFSNEASDDEQRPAVLSINATEPPLPTEQLVDQLQQQAFDEEDAGNFEAAIDCYHVLLARGQGRAELSFQLAELLYRIGELAAARERYLVAIELDPDFVEARASLGGLLAELGRQELAVAAFRGALAIHDDYPDVHYNLARTLDDLDRPAEADHHWRRFIQLAPESPWAQEARQRLDSPDYRR